jgi:Zn-dependent peptidase ImmA (M78 family)
MAADFNRAQAEAEKILKKYGTKHPPVDPEAIAESMGVDVVYAHFKEPHDQEVSGFIELEPSPRIVVNAAIHPNRKTFTIAHELAHFVLHKDYARSGNYRILPRRNEYNGNKPDEEREADAFAANLLVPNGELKRYASLASVHELARMFLVSDQVISNRLRHIGHSYP